MSKKICPKHLKMRCISSQPLCCMFLGGFSRDGLLGPSQELLASLQSLGENSDYTLLPHSLHQVCVCVCVCLCVYVYVLVHV